MGLTTAQADLFTAIFEKDILKVEQLITPHPSTGVRQIGENINELYYEVERCRESIDPFIALNPLCIAAIAGQDKIIDLLFKHFEDVDIDKKCGELEAPALHYAIAGGGHLECVKNLLARGANVNVSNKLGHRASHLTTRAFGRKEQILECLLEAGIDLYAKNLADNTVLDVMVFCKAHASFTMIEMILEYGFDLSLCKINKIENIPEECSKEVKQILMEYSPIQYAVDSQESVESLEKLSLRELIQARETLLEENRILNKELLDKLDSLQRHIMALDYTESQDRFIYRDKNGKIISDFDSLLIDKKNLFGHFHNYTAANDVDRIKSTVSIILLPYGRNKAEILNKIITSLLYEMKSHDLQDDRCQYRLKTITAIAPRLEGCNTRDLKNILYRREYRGNDYYAENLSEDSDIDSFYDWDSDKEDRFSRSRLVFGDEFPYQDPNAKRKMKKAMNVNLHQDEYESLIEYERQHRKWVKRKLKNKEVIRKNAQNAKEKESKKKGPSSSKMTKPKKKELCTLKEDSKITSDFRYHFSPIRKFSPLNKGRGEGQSSVLIPSSKLSSAQQEQAVADLEILNLHIRAGMPLAQAITKIKTRFFIAQYRGTTYNFSWNAPSRRAHRNFDETGLAAYSNSVYKTVQFGIFRDFSPEKRQELEQLLANVGRKSRAMLLSMRNTGVYKHRVKSKKYGDHDYIFDNFAEYIQELYVNSYEKFHSMLRSGELLEDKDQYFLNDGNPFISTSDAAYQALRYGGGKAYKGDEDNFLKPRWNKKGRAERPYVGKVYASLHSLTDYEQESPMHVVSLHEQARCQISKHMIWERETTFPAYMEKGKVFFQLVFRYPNFSSPYCLSYLEKYGMDEKLYDLFKRAVLSFRPHTLERSYVEKKLTKWLCLYQQAKLIQLAFDQAQEQGGILVYRNNEGGFSLELAEVHVSSPYIQEKREARRASF